MNFDIKKARTKKSVLDFFLYLSSLFSSYVVSLIQVPYVVFSNGLYLMSDYLLTLRLTHLAITNRIHPCLDLVLMLQSY